MFEFQMQQIATAQSAQFAHDEMVRLHNEQFQRQLLANPSEAPANASGYFSLLSGVFLFVFDSTESIFFLSVNFSLLNLSHSYLFF